MGTLTEQERAFLDNTKRGIDNQGFGVFINNVNQLVAIIDRLTTPDAQELAEARNTLHVEKIQRLADKLAHAGDNAPGNTDV